MNTFSVPDNIRLLLPLLSHLCNFGEANPQEIESFVSEDWIVVLQKIGFSFQPEIGYLFAPPNLLSYMSWQSEIALLRKFFLLYPPYRHRLLAILSQGLITAGQQSLLSQLESWILQVSPALVQEINVLIDKLEVSGEQLVELTKDTIEARFDDLYASFPGFSAWDQTLLGLSATPPDLFPVVLEKFGRLAPLLTVPETTGEGLPALLPELPLPDPNVSPQFEVWTTARKHFHSSLPLFNSDGTLRFVRDQLPLYVWQDALAEQPFYRAVIHLAYIHRLGIGELDQLCLRCPSPLAETQIEIGGRPMGRLSERLAMLTGAMGYQALLPAELAAGRSSNLLENLMKVRILEWVEDRLQLAEAYALSLGNPPRALRLARGPGKQERDQILKALKTAKR